MILRLLGLTNAGMQKNHSMYVQTLL